MFSLANKVAIVTGASRGIGKVIAKVFANADSHVVCVARTENAIKSLSDEINANGGSSSFQTWPARALSSSTSFELGASPPG